MVDKKKKRKKKFAASDVPVQSSDSENDDIAVEPQEKAVEEQVKC